MEAEIQRRTLLPVRCLGLGVPSLGTLQTGFKSPVEIPDMKMNQPPPEAKRGRATDRVKEGCRPGRSAHMAVSQNEIVRFALNNRWLEEQGVPDLNAVAATVALKKPRSLTAWTELCGVKAIWIVLHYGPRARV